MTKQAKRTTRGRLSPQAARIRRKVMHRITRNIPHDREDDQFYRRRPAQGPEAQRALWTWMPITTLGVYEERLQGLIKRALTEVLEEELPEQGH